MSGTVWRNGPAKQMFDFASAILHEMENNTNQTTSHSIVKRMAGNKIKAAHNENEPDYSVLIGMAVGAFGMFGLCYAYFVDERLGIYLLALAVYHALEYFYVWKFHVDEVTSNSFLFFPNQYYHYAIGFSIVEYLVEMYMFPWHVSLNKRSETSFYIGLAGIIIGQFFRSGAMWTAGSNFHHLVRTEKEDGHVLVTTGVYGIFRHPSYFGWFYWALSLQILCMNPICLIAFPFVLWKFFSSRILSEEAYLIEIFGDAYIEYKQKVWTCGIPFITNTPVDVLMSQTNVAQGI